MKATIEKTGDYYLVRFATQSYRAQFVVPTTSQSHRRLAKLILATAFTRIP